jgi:O-antigen/teichoic acid export membrane protein
MDTATAAVWGAIGGMFVAILVGTLWEWWRERNPK